MFRDMTHVLDRWCVSDLIRSTCTRCTSSDGYLLLGIKAGWLRSTCIDKGHVASEWEASSDSTVLVTKVGRFRMRRPAPLCIHTQVRLPRGDALPISS